jgi:hypothetical protein
MRVASQSQMWPAPATQGVTTGPLPLGRPSGCGRRAYGPSQGCASVGRGRQEWSLRPLAPRIRLYGLRGGGPQAAARRIRAGERGGGDAAAGGGPGAAQRKSWRRAGDGSQLADQELGVAQRLVGVEDNLRPDAGAGVIPLAHARRGEPADRV